MIVVLQTTLNILATIRTTIQQSHSTFAESAHFTMRSLQSCQEVMLEEFADRCFTRLGFLRVRLMRSPVDARRDKEMQRMRLQHSHKELRTRMSQLRNDFETVLLPLLQNNPAYLEQVRAAIRSIDKLSA
jgi:hypothetical protein